MATALWASLALGCGARTGLDEPAPVAEAPVSTRPGLPALPALPGVTDLSAGLFHTCAVRKAGDTWCWGFNNAGQLGDGTDLGSHAPVRVLALDGAVLVRAGREHTCALTGGDGVRCWGSNRYGQLGAGTPDGRSLEPVAVGVPGEVVDLAAGGQHTCALAADGVVACWGDDSWGQLGGVMDPTRRATFSRPDLPAVSAIAAGWLHGCAVLRDDGGVRCWGNNHAGQLGRPAAHLEASAEPVVVPLPGQAVSVAAGDFHGCAVLESGEVWCWGSNEHGQLGDGSTEPAPGPVRAVAIDDALEVSAGHEHTCALRRGGRVACWGRADRGQLGLVTDSVHLTTPTPSDALDAVVQITMGWRHGCARREDDGVLCWGRNVEGQLGSGVAAMRQTPTPVDLP